MAFLQNNISNGNGTQNMCDPVYGGWNANSIEDKLSPVGPGFNGRMIVVRKTKSWQICHAINI